MGPLGRRRPPQLAGWVGSRKKPANPAFDGRAAFGPNVLSRRGPTHPACYTVEKNVKHSPHMEDMEELSEFDKGIAVGLLIGEGSFGGDGKQPQITLRMHVRHEALFRWLMQRFPRTKLYGPYHHGGRSYYQWMARGTALIEDVLPLLEARLSPDLDGHASERFEEMVARYSGFIARERSRLASVAKTADSADDR
jgi:hypothetical protein